MVFVYIVDDVIKCFRLIKFESGLSYHQRIHVAHTHDSFSPGTLHLKTVWLWRLRFLITVINANDQISRVKPADTNQT
jgi:hypothetical protein